MDVDPLPPALPLLLLAAPPALAPVLVLLLVVLALWPALLDFVPACEVCGLEASGPSAGVSLLLPQALTSSSQQPSQVAGCFVIGSFLGEKVG